MQEAIHEIDRMLEQRRFEDALAQVEPILAAAAEYAGLLDTVRQLATVLTCHSYGLSVLKQDDEAMLLEGPLRRARALLGEDVYGTRIR